MAGTPKSFWNGNQAEKCILRCQICIADADQDYILDEIMNWDQIKITRHIDIDDESKSSTKYIF